jgi:AbrB family looped-hinge helix DNA binding protein
MKNRKSEIRTPIPTEKRETPPKKVASSIAIVRPRGQITLPREVREAARIEEGDPVEIENTAEGILLRPKKLIDADQAWFWTRPWQTGEREASDDIARGRVKAFESDEEFLASLE